MCVLLTYLLTYLLSLLCYVTVADTCPACLTKTNLNGAFAFSVNVTQLCSCQYDSASLIR